MTPVVLHERLALGTAQLGFSYGINNKTGKPDREEASRILDRALQLQIHTLDSAEAYGDSLSVIGSYLKANPEAQFNIISKFIEDGQSMEEKLKISLHTLHRKNIYAYLYHRFADYEAGKSKSALLRLKETGKIAKVGVSVYGNDELETVLRDPEMDIIQIPFNVFDSSPEKRTLLEEAKASGKEIHVRSVFLQGLFFKRPKELTGNLTRLTSSLQEFHRIIKQYDVDIMQACLNHALQCPFIDRVVIGVEKSVQLEQNVDALLLQFPDELIKQLESIVISDVTLLNPSNWKST